MARAGRASAAGGGGRHLELDCGRAQLGGMTKKLEKDTHKKRPEEEGVNHSVDMQANTLADLILVTPSLAVPALLTYILQHPAYITQPLHPPPPPPAPPHTVELTHQLPWRWPPNSAPYLGQCRPWPPPQLFLPPKTGRGPEFHWGR